MPFPNHGITKDMGANLQKSNAQVWPLLINEKCNDSRWERLDVAPFPGHDSQFLEKLCDLINNHPPLDSGHFVSRVFSSFHEVLSAKR